MCVQSVVSVFSISYMLLGVFWFIGPEPRGGTSPRPIPIKLWHSSLKSIYIECGKQMYIPVSVISKDTQFWTVLLVPQTVQLNGASFDALVQTRSQGARRVYLEISETNPGKPSCVLWLHLSYSSFMQVGKYSFYIS